MQGRIPSKNIKSLFEIHFRAQGKPKENARQLCGKRNVKAWSYI